MFERYTDTARRVIFSARYMTFRAGSAEIATEHLLLGLLREDKGLANRFLGSPWAAEDVWKEVSAPKLPSGHLSHSAEIPLASASKRVLNFAAEEADRTSKNQINTGHFLMGLLRESDSLAARILRERGVYLDSVRESLLQSPHDDSATQQFTRDRPPLPPDVAETRARIEAIKSRVYAAVANRDFDAARENSEAERAESEQFFLLCQKHNLTDWIFY